MTVWVPDLLLGHEAREIALPGAAPARGEPAGTRLRATLVRRLPVASRAAVLYVHGWNDYFFAAHLGDHLARCGHDFYALDLRRCGRSLAPGQLPGYVADLDDYDDELGAAVEEVAATHDRLVLLGHSTGGLVVATWAARHPAWCDAVVLSSPWLEVPGPAPLVGLADRFVDRWGAVSPTTPLPVPGTGHYRRSVHAEHGGEWDYDLALKPSPSPPVRLGWLRAVRRAHARVAAGLDLPVPVLVLLSRASSLGRTWHEGLRGVDTVLDVDRTAARAAGLGRHVTIVRVDGALHDVFLSAPVPREVALQELTRWLATYEPAP